MGVPNDIFAHAHVVIEPFVPYRNAVLYRNEPHAPHVRRKLHIRIDPES